MRCNQAEHATEPTLTMAVAFTAVFTMLVSASCLSASQTGASQDHPGNKQQPGDKQQPMTIEEAYNYKNVDDQFSTSGLISKHQLSTLRAAGYETVINLLPNDSEYAVQEEQTIVERQGLDYRHIAVDFANPTDEDFATFVALMKESKDKKIIVHCAANYRASAFFSSYAFQELGWSSSQVKEFMATIWNPAEYPAWQAFIDRQLRR